MFAGVPLTLVTADVLVHMVGSISVTVSESVVGVADRYPVRVTPQPWLVAPAAPGPVSWS